MKKILTTVLIASFLFAQTLTVRAHQNSFENPSEIDQVEPNAGNWRTWVISSGRDYRVPAPPGPAETQAELRSLADLIGSNNEQVRQQIAFWDAGAPTYRWIDLINSRVLAGTATMPYPHRV
ncbi:MAG TPA: hypothetical protein VJ372_25670, partial [Pyrinomonadaceae bacterium]|nr:hypothetical protein [Pyrinomonadaceae bacterium]